MQNERDVEFRHVGREKHKNNNGMEDVASLPSLLGKGSACKSHLKNKLNHYRLSMMAKYLMGRCISAYIYYFSFEQIIYKFSNIYIPDACVYKRKYSEYE